jgi:hypothetical protein
VGKPSRQPSPSGRGSKNSPRWRINQPRSGGNQHSLPPGPVFVFSRVHTQALARKDRTILYTRVTSGWRCVILFRRRPEQVSEERL